jgi:hypothetical protein
MSSRLAFASFAQEVPPPGRLSKHAMYINDDFLALIWSTSVTAGSGTNIYTTGVEAGAPGVARQSVTFTATPDRALLLTNAVANAANVIVGGGPITCEVRTRTPTLQDATDRWSDRSGMGDGNTGDAVDGVYFEVDLATHGDSNVRLCASSNSVRTKTSLGVGLTAATWERWKFVINRAGDSVQAYLNDAAVGSPVTTNLPSGAGRSFAPTWLQIIKTLGAVNTRSVDRDYIETYQEFDDEGGSR